MCCKQSKWASIKMWSIMIRAKLWREGISKMAGLERCSVMQWLVPTKSGSRWNKQWTSKKKEKILAIIERYKTTQCLLCMGLCSWLCSLIVPCWTPCPLLKVATMVTGASTLNRGFMEDGAKHILAWQSAYARSELHDDMVWVSWCRRQQYLYLTHILTVTLQNGVCGNFLCFCLWFKINVSCIWIELINNSDVLYMTFLQLYQEPLITQSGTRRKSR